MLLSRLSLLRDYQTASVGDAREGLKLHRAFMIQLPTGGGKTPIEAQIINLSVARGHRVWIIAPRNELLDQIGAHIKRHGVQFAFIRAGMNESRAFKVHVVSKQTLDRRWDKIKNWPDLIIIDEAHLNFDFQRELFERAPATTRFLGFTATPERTDGTGLKTQWVISTIETGDRTFPRIFGRKNLGGIWGNIAYGPSIPWLTEREFLAPLRYFAPPIEGLDKLHWRKGEVDADELDELLERRKVYGDVVKYYQKHGVRENGTPKPALIFCRSVKSAKETARQFEEAGFKFLPIWGGMPKTERDAALNGIRTGRLDGLTNCDLATYGLDVPNLEYMASIRPTQSRALYFQMVGRGLRPAPDKLFAVFFDHVNMVRDHQDERYPGVPLFYIDDVQWNFEGRVKRPRVKLPETAFLAQCPLQDFMYCHDPACAKGCRLQSEDEREGRREALEIDETVQLEEIKRPVKFSDLAPEEKRDFQDRVGSSIQAAVDALAAGEIAPGPIGKLLALAAQTGRQIMWVYHAVQEEFIARKASDAGMSRDDYLRGVPQSVNMSLLHEIGRQKAYKPTWPYIQKRELQAQLDAKVKDLKQGVLI